MPTSKPRLMLTLQPATMATIKRLAHLQQRPAASVVSDYLESVAPVLERIADALDNAQRHQLALSADMLDTLEGAQQRIEPVLADLFAGLADIADAEPQPPVCNHGGQNF